MTRHYVLDTRTATPHFPGIGRYVTNLARALPPLLAEDERLTLLTAAGVPGAAFGVPRSEFRVSVSSFSLAQQWVVPRLLHRIGASLYHSAYYLMPYRPGAPAVVTIYDLIPMLFPQHSTARARLLFRMATLLALRTASRIVAISAATAQDVQKHFRVDPSRIHTIPLAADPIFQPQPAAVIANLRRSLDLPERYVLYFGSNKPHKNLPRLIEAWALMQRSGGLAGGQDREPGRGHANDPLPQLLLAGAWDERYPEAKQLVAQMGLSHAVRFLGPLADASLPALYAGAELFVFPSLYEGFGLPVLEAMACGAIVACSNTSSLPEVAGDAALLFDPTQPAAIAATITRALGQSDTAPADREALRKRSLAQAARFSWSQTAQATLAVYRDVVIGD